MHRRCLFDSPLKICIFSPSKCVWKSQEPHWPWVTYATWSGYLCILSLGFLPHPGPGNLPVYNILTKSNSGSQHHSPHFNHFTVSFRNVSQKTPQSILIIQLRFLILFFLERQSCQNIFFQLTVSMCFFFLSWNLKCFWTLECRKPRKDSK